MAVTIAETSGHVTETELKSPLSPPVTMRRNDRSHSPKYALDAQELDSSASTGAVYWEGLSDLTHANGQAAGRGYLEMTGYTMAMRL